MRDVTNFTDLFQNDVALNRTYLSLPIRTSRLLNIFSRNS